MCFRFMLLHLLMTNCNLSIIETKLLHCLKQSKFFLRTSILLSSAQCRLLVWITKRCKKSRFTHYNSNRGNATLQSIYLHFRCYGIPNSSSVCRKLSEMCAAATLYWYDFSYNVKEIPSEQQVTLSTKINQIC